MYADARLAGRDAWLRTVQCRTASHAVARFVINISLLSLMVGTASVRAASVTADSNAGRHGPAAVAPDAPEADLRRADVDRTGPVAGVGADSPDAHALALGVLSSEHETDQSPVSGLYVSLALTLVVGGLLAGIHWRTRKLELG